MANRDHNLLLRLCIIWYVILFSDQCTEIYDRNTCTFNVYCKNTDLDLNGWDYYRQDSNEYSSLCHSNVIFHGYEMNSINVYIENSNLYHCNFPSNGNHDDALTMVISLDLSNNNITCFPKVRTMPNLVSLNLSKNSFGIANLDNILNELPSLKEIDLSHSNINNFYKSDTGFDNNIFKTLEVINLSYNTLETVPTVVLDEFNNLKNLDLSHNNIEILSSITFEGMKNLVHLNMSYNGISDINNSLFRFRELKTLDLSGNKLVNIKANDFNALTKLTTLNMRSNLITSIDKDTFLNLHFLHTLDLSDNELEKLDRDLFKNVNGLKDLIISKNKFTKLPKSMLKGKSIESFSIVENNLEGSIERGTFEGLQLVTELDLSNQHLDSVEDNAFYGLRQLVTLLLQNNNIKTLSPKCFNMLIYLKQLDLSNNKIVNIDFEKDNLGNLESLSIRNNYLSIVKQEHFQGLESLQVLDLSDNKISRLESNSFKSLKNLISFEISNNPLNGTLEENTFEGLNSLPSLDISCTLLNTIQNGSFNKMTQLINLNISRSKIQTLQFNSFIYTSAINILDLSHNNIKEFKVNNTHISKLNTLYLNDNHIKSINSQTFDHMLLLSKIILSYNEIETINSLAFENKKFLRVLDVSYNPNLIFNVLLINNTDSINELYLSGTKPGMAFGEIEMPLSHIKISNSSIVDIKELKLNKLSHLDNLDLSHNQISKVDFGCFNNISAIETVDLSFNKITYIQPGAFKYNTELRLLNISHNQLSSVTYGIFRGLIYLKTLDISYNNIDNLHNKRFHELRSLSVLIADHNRIETLNIAEFLGTSLSKLSIGDNPIPCNLLVNLTESKYFEITAIKLDEHNSENVNGITCNKYKDTIPIKPGVLPVKVDNEYSNSILVNIRDILLNKLNSNEHEINVKYEEYLVNITSQLAKNNFDSHVQLSNLTKLATQIANRNETNAILEKIFKLMTVNSLKRPTTPAPISKDNATYGNLVNYINKLKQQLDDTIAFEKNSILTEVDIKLAAINKVPTTAPVTEKLSASSSESKHIFIETCVAFILLILVCFVLYKFYKSGLFRRHRLSISTRELPGAMDSTF